MKKEPRNSSKKADNVRVCVRVRPLNSHEKTSGDRRIIDNLDNQIYLRHHKKTKCFSFDNVYDDSHSQEHIFVNFGKGLIEKFVEGYNCCVFAYGQTGAGKTYTMQGKLGDDVHRGLMPRSLNYLFFMINEKTRSQEPVPTMSNGSCEFIVKLTVIEIYNEVVYDLLAEAKNTRLNLREDIKKGVFLENVTEEIVASFYEAQDIIKRGLDNRQVGFTHANNASSRSHCVVTVHFESRRRVGQQAAHADDEVKAFQYSKFNFVDLAGSERQKNTKAKGKRLKEGCNINKSLTILGSVINSLAGKRKNQFVRYRDSKLTFLLKDSLGGNSKTVFISNVSPSAMYYVETLSTLLFAQRAKMIKNKAIINKDIKGGNVEKLRAELAKAKLELSTLQEKYRVLEESQMNNIDIKSESEFKEQQNQPQEGPQSRQLQQDMNEKMMVLQNAVKEKYLILKGAVQECLHRLGLLVDGKLKLKGQSLKEELAQSAEKPYLKKEYLKAETPNANTFLVSPFNGESEI